MRTKTILASCLLSSTMIFGASHVFAQENTNYRYGQLLVQRSQSAWDSAPSSTNALSPAATAPVYTPAPSVVPRLTPNLATTYTPLAPAPERKVAPVRPVITHASPKTETATPPLSPAQSNPALGAYYMPAPPINTEPELAPGESLAPTPPAEILLPSAPSETPSLESQPFEDEHSILRQSAEDGFARRYVSGPPVPPHPGSVVSSPSGPAFKGPIASDPGFIPSWLKVKFGNAYRVDTIKTQRYISASSGQTQDIHEEWDGLSSYELVGGAEFTNRTGMLKGLHMQGQASYGWIIDGDAQEETTSTTPPLTADEPPAVITQNRSRDASSGNVSGMKAAIGYDFMPDFITPAEGRSSFIPLLGYAIAKQEVTAKADDGSAYDSINYQTEWRGPFIGLQVEIEKPEFNFGLSGSMHWAQYEGDGNYRSDQPASGYHFTEESDALGFNFSGNFGVVIYDGLDAFLSASFDAWKADGGVSNRSFQTGTSAIRMDEVSWRSQSYQIGLAYRW